MHASHASDSRRSTLGKSMGSGQRPWLLAAREAGSARVQPWRQPLDHDWRCRVRLDLGMSAIPFWLSPSPTAPFPRCAPLPAKRRTVLPAAKALLDYPENWVIPKHVCCVLLAEEVPQ